MPRIQAASLQDHTRQKREQILTAAFAVLEREGYAAATLNRVARDCGLARNSIYKYFPDRNRLLFESIMRRIEMLLDEARVEIRRQAEPVDRILAWVDALTLHCGGEEQRLLHLAATLEVPQAEQRQRLQQVHFRMFEQLRADFAEALAGTGFDPHLWSLIYDATARGAGLYGYQHGNLDQARHEARMASRGFFLTRFTPNGLAVVHP